MVVKERIEEIRSQIVKAHSVEDFASAYGLNFKRLIEGRLDESEFFNNVLEVLRKVVSPVLGNNPVMNEFNISVLFDCFQAVFMDRYRTNVVSDLLEYIVLFCYLTENDDFFKIEVVLAPDFS